MHFFSFRNVLKPLLAAKYSRHVHFFYVSMKRRILAMIPMLICS